MAEQDAREAWKIGVKAARDIFDENLETLLVDFSGMFAGIQGSTIHVGTKEELYKLIDFTVPYLVILIEENPPPTVDVFSRMEQRRKLMDRLTVFAGSLDDAVFEEVIQFAEMKYKESR